MSSRTPTSRSTGTPGTVTRRQVLTAGGVAAVAGLAGCLDRVAESTTNTGAAPAAVFAGPGDTDRLPIRHSDTLRVAPAIRVDGGPVSGDVELEGWVTTQQTAATNYNNTRSNRSTIRSDGDADDDGLGDGTERASALETERAILADVEAVTGHVENRAAGDATAGLERIQTRIGEVRETLRRCGDDVCVTVSRNADARLGLAREATTAVERGEWERAASHVRDIRAIVRGDVDRLGASLRASAAGSISKRAARTGRVRELTGASDGEMDALYEYLAATPVIGERFTIALPDARVPGGSAALVDELTPRRLLEYVTGREDTDGAVYSWGDSQSDPETPPQRDNGSPLYEGDAVGGESAIYRGDLLANSGVQTSPLAESDVFRSLVSGPFDTGANLDAYAASGSVCVVNAAPGGDDRTSSLAVAADGTASDAHRFDDWGDELGDSAATSTIVCPIMALPAACPVPCPALLYVRRCRNDDQYLYTGGWALDDAGLYENAVTVLTAEGPTPVVGVGEGDLDGDGYGDVIARSLRTDRARQGAGTAAGTLRELLDSDAIPAAVVRDGNDILLRKRPGRTAASDGGDATSGEGGDFGVCVPLDAPVLHLAGAAEASNEVKFKAGAELSKSVN